MSDFVCRVVDRDGRTRWVRCKSSPTDWLGEKAAITFVQDITAQMQAEAALRENVDIVNTMFMSVQDAFYLATMDDGRLIEMNGAFANMFGFERHEALGRTSGELGLWADYEDRTGMVRQLKSKGFVRNYQVTGHRKTGELFPVSISTTVCEIGGTKCIVGFMRDETERLQAERALRESEARYRLLADNITDVIWMLDPRTLRFTYVSPSCELLTGYTSDELLNLPLSDVFPLHVREPLMLRVQSGLEQFLVQSDPFVDDQREVELLRKDGSSIWTEISTRMLRNPGSGQVGVMGVARDQSARKEAERALQQKQEQLARFFSLEVGLLCIADTDGYFHMVSAGWENALGYSQEELLSRPFLDLVHPEDLPATLEAISRLRAQEQVVDFANRYRAKEGSYRTIQWRSAPAGDLIYAAARDVTDLLAAEEQLRQSQKMEAIGQLAGGIAHDFNNLLTAILGYTDLVLATPEGRAEPLRLDLLEIKGAAKRAADLTQQILAFSRKQALRPEIICVNDVLGELKPLLGRILGEDIILEIQPSDDIGLCELDPGQFTQVLMNLVVNARDAMPGGGFLILETANAEVTEQAALANPGRVSPGSYVTLRCSDTGVGMDPATRSRIFEPFFTTKPPGEGTGLGLSTVHGIVHQSGGAVVVESEVGKGTVFTIYVPRIAGSAGPSPGEDELPDPRRGHGRVLIVEDEGAVGALAERVLAAHGYTVLLVSNASDALPILSAPGQKLDLLLTDIVLPAGMQGRELGDVARSAREDLRVLYMSGYSRNSIVHGGRLDEGVNFLPKPFTPQELIAKVEEVLTQHNEPARTKRNWPRAKEDGIVIDTPFKSEARILVVDDERSIVRLLTRTLESEGYSHVTGMTESVGVPDYLDSAPPDMIVLDLNMPGLDGFQLLAEISARLPKDTFLPVLVLSGLHDIESKERAFQIGAKDYLTKPVELSEFLVHVDSLLQTRFMSLRLQDAHHVMARVIGRQADELYKSDTERKRAEDELRESEFKFRTVADFAHDWEYWVGLDRRLVWVSPSCERVTGYRADEFMADPGLIEAVVYPEDRAGVAEHVSQAVNGDTASLDFRIVTKSGETRWISHQCVGVYDQAGRHLGRRASNRDITDGKRAEELLLLTQFSVDHAADSVFWLDPEGFVVFVSDATCQILGYARSELLNMTIFDVDPTLIPSRYQQNWESIKAHRTIRFETLHQKADGTLVPVEVTLNHVVFENQEYNCVFARDITDRKETEERLAESLARIRESQATIIQVLSSVTEFRDPYTAGHQQRVAEMCVAIATRMGLAPHRIEGLEVAALLHDVGKVCVPLEILSTPGKFSPLQRLLVEGHVSAGYEILRPIFFSWPIAEIARQHHERMDGSGYPAQLCGEQIMLEARILGVADTFEAMTTHRPYRGALEIGVALHEIKAGSGTLFDEAVVDALVSMVADGSVAPRIELDLSACSFMS